ncbi:LysR family transcriptional regulator [Halalkalibacter urbisdiaboli]|uniref:LysR family transcriptional regulator n=1 Tax=Halalkalibacter urbisdiaboli TaxID=1960589 RepID=UPI000B442404|nr:LysR family transcriptional regulator [Halalkalibacter urbisdiaboli]
MMIDYLKTFITVVEQRHFSRTAKILNLSQPNVSLHIRHLEKEFETKLLNRSPKQVQVTEEGEILYIRAKKILSLVEEVKQEINERKEIVKGTLKIGASFTIGEYILPSILAKYAAEHPLVKVEVTVANTEEVIAKVRTHEIEIGLIEGESSTADLTMEPFMEDEMIIIAPPDHSLSQLRIVKPEMLQDQVWIWRESGSGTRAYSDQLIAQLDLNVKHFFIFSSSQGIKEAVSAGLGIAMISKWTVRKELQTGEIKKLNINNRTFTRNFSMIQARNGSLTKAQQLFLQKVEQTKEEF